MNENLDKMYQDVVEALEDSFFAWCDSLPDAARGTVVTEEAVWDNVFSGGDGLSEEDVVEIFDFFTSLRSEESERTND